MKINRETFTYWIVLGVSLGLSQFGFSIRMEFTSEARPFSEVWASAELYRAFQFYPDAGLFLIFLTGVIGGFVLPHLGKEKERALLFSEVALIGIGPLRLRNGGLDFL
ncbi:MAG: hypothetical protein ACJAVK_002744 [Akkermansiaceae bacterium]|jgi:hypothetical protein